MLGERWGATTLCLRRLVETRRYQECRADCLHASFRKVPDLLWELVTLSEYMRAQFRAWIWPGLWSRSEEVQGLGYASGIG